MKKFTIFLALLVLLSGCSTNAPPEKITPKEDPPQKQDEVIEETPPIKDLVRTFENTLFPDLNKVKTKEELITSLLTITNQDIANIYVNYFYSEERDGLRLNHKNSLAFINPYSDYKLDKIKENNYILYQDNNSELYGKYHVAVQFEKLGTTWSIQNINLQFENQVSYLDVTSDLQSILLLANKHHNLPGNYIPSDLVEVQVPFPNGTTGERRHLRTEAAIHLEEMFKDAKANNIILYGRSGYRSYKTQEALFAYYVNRYGSEDAANQISAHPGQSEHQTGLTMDVTAQSINYDLTKEFGDTKEGKWLKENAHRFGFIIRYPKGKEAVTEYDYEPWHIRYVGKIVAKEIWKKGLTYEEYLEVNNK